MVVRRMETCGCCKHTADAIGNLRQDLREIERRWDKSCELRHDPITERVDRIERKLETMQCDVPHSQNVTRSDSAEKTKTTRVMWGAAAAIVLSLAMSIIEVIKTWK
jgi:hypothetical protein